MGVEEEAKNEFLEGEKNEEQDINSTQQEGYVWVLNVYQVTGLFDRDTHVRRV